MPPGFTITTEVCAEFYKHGKEAVIEMLRPEVERAMKNIEKLTGMKFGDKEMPLLVSVRSGARASMPGMMDTILNLGMNDQAVEAVAKRTGNPRFAWDSYRRFVQMYGDVVLGMKPVSKEDHDPFEVIIEEQKAKKGVKNDTDLTTDDLKELVKNFKAAVKKQTGEDFPTCPWDQLWGAICAVFGSWMNERAILYRKLNNIPAEWGTAVSVQAMVFGNMGENSATGVAFSRDAATGENLFNGEYLINAQGEDVVAGIRTPQQITIEGSKRWAVAQKVSEEERRRSSLARRGDARGLQGAGRNPAPPGAILQGHAGHRIHDSGRQTLDAPVPQRQAHGRGDGQDRHGHAARGSDRREDRRTALRACEARRTAPPRLRQEGHRQAQVITKGLPASPGAATGPVVFFAEDAEKVLEKTGTARHSGAHRDFARGPQGHARRGRYPDRTRRHDLARGRRGARHGQMLRIGRRRIADRL